MTNRDVKSGLRPKETVGLRGWVTKVDLPRQGGSRPAIQPWLARVEVCVRRPEQVDSG